MFEFVKYSTKRKGFTEGVKIVAFILLVVVIVIILIVIANKILNQGGEQGANIISSSSECIGNLITGEGCNK